VSYPRLHNKPSVELRCLDAFRHRLEEHFDKGFMIDDDSILEVWRNSMAILHQAYQALSSVFLRAP
jgi:hypothetical protein